jgi:hypothetical protein
MSILKYTCSLLVACGLSVGALCAQTADAPQTVVQEAAEQVAKTPVYQGTYFSVDLFNPVATLLNGGRFEASVAVDVSLWQRLFPVVELGVMTVNQKQDTYHFEATGGFAKVGFNYNFLNFKTDRKYDHIVYAGARYGYSYTGYQLSDAQISNEYWQESGVYSTGKRGAHFGWLEIQAGVRVQVYKSLFMGVALQIKTFGHYYQQSAYYPTYVAGFGVNSEATNFGFLYHLCYQLPYKK